MPSINLKSLLSWWVAAIAAAGCITILTSVASAQTLSMGTDRAGTTFNVIGTGIAKVVGDHSDVRISVRPFAGPDAYLPMLDSGEMNLAAVSAFSVWESYNGVGVQGDTLKNLRILRSGAGSLYVGLIARADSGIHTVAELKGKRLAGSFGGHSAVTRSLDAALSAAGISLDDVTQVPVVGIVDGINALVAGRVDATWVSYGQPQVREAHSQIGVRYLPLPDGDKALAIMREKAFPGVQIKTVSANPSIGVEKAIPLMTYDSYLVASEDMDPAVVKALLDALWENEGQLTSIQRALSGFTNDEAVTSVPVAPYLPAAADFYKQKGVWTPEAEKAQAELAAAAK